MHLYFLKNLQPSVPSQKKKKTSIRNGESFSKKRKSLVTPPVDGTSSFVKYQNHAPRRSAADMILDRPAVFKSVRVWFPNFLTFVISIR